MHLSRWLYTLACIAVFALGLAMRSPEIVSGNYLFGFDQGQNYLRAYDIAVNHKFTLIGAEVGSGSAGVPGLFHGPGFYYLLAIVLLIFHGDPYGGLVLMWSGGVLTLLLSYFLTRRMFGRIASLVVLLLVSIAPLIAPQSRFVWGPHLAGALIVPFYYFLYKITDRPVLYTFMAALMAGFLYNFELALSVPLVLVLFVSLFVYKVWSLRVFVSFALGIVISMAPMFLFEARHGFTAVNGIIGNITQSKPSSQGPPAVPQSDPFRISQKKIQFISNFRDSFVFERGYITPSWYNTTLLILAVIMIVSITKLAGNKLRTYMFVTSLSIPVSFLVFLPLRGNIWPYYLIHLYFVYIFVSAVTVSLVSRALYKRQWIWLPAGMFLVFFLASTAKGAHFRVINNWAVDYADYGGKDKIFGKKAIIDYIYKDAGDSKFNVLVFMPPVYTWPYDYLFLTYAKQKYGYQPGTEKKGITYLIIEVDGEKPWSYKGWLETVIKDGEVLWERRLEKQDVIVQKRLFR